MINISRFASIIPHICVGNLPWNNTICYQETHCTQMVHNNLFVWRGIDVSRRLITIGIIRLGVVKMDTE